MAETFLSLVPNVEDILSLEVEDLAGVVFEVMPGVMQNDLVHAMALAGQPFPNFGGGYPENRRKDFSLAVAEAMGWLQAQGLIVQDPQQAAGWFRITRRGARTIGRHGVQAYKRARDLPIDLLYPALTGLRAFFVRGEYRMAVFEAFREVEIAVRNASNAKGAGYSNDQVGVALMRRAFHPDDGPLADMNLVKAEREADAALFAGAIGSRQEPGWS
jgi:hypothetical protein